MYGLINKGLEMNQIHKSLLLAATLLIAGQSTCSDSSKTGLNFFSFKFPSWSLPAWPIMPSFSFFRSSSSILPVLSPSHKDTAKKWVPVAVATGILGAGGSLWFYRNRRTHRNQTSFPLAKTAVVDQKPVETTTSTAGNTVTNAADTKKCYFRVQDITDKNLFGTDFQKHECPKSANNRCFCSQPELQLYSFTDIQEMAQKTNRTVIRQASQPFVENFNLAKEKQALERKIKCFQNQWAMARDCRYNGFLTKEIRDQKVTEFHTWGPRVQEIDALLKLNTK